MAKDSLGAAVVGTGFGFLTHLRALRKAGIEVRALVGRDPAKTADRAKRAGVPHAITHLPDALALPGVDLVTVATPPHTHAEIAIAACEAGKHVMCEKPFAANLEEAERMLDAAQRAGVAHFLGTEFRFATGQAVATRAVRQGAIGAPRLATFLLLHPGLADPRGAVPAWWGDAAQGGGWLGAYASHVVDQTRATLGDWAGLSASLDLVSARDWTAEDSFTIHFRTVDGCSGILQSSCGTWGPPGFSSRISGPDGTLTILGDAVSVADAHGVRELEIPDELRNPAPNPPDRDLLVTAYDMLHSMGLDIGPFTKLFRCMRDTIQGAPTPRDPVPGTFDDGVALQRIMDAIRRSNTQGSWERLAEDRPRRVAGYASLPMSDSERAPGITEEGVARLRARIGIAEPHPQPPHYRSPNEDAFRHVAEAIGDDNPLWCDPEYAANTRWSGLIAPPALVGGDTLIGEDEVGEVAPEHRQLMRGDPLRGVHAFYAGSFHEWWHPLRPGQRVFRRNALIGVLDKQSDFAERAIHEWTAQVFRDGEGHLLSGQYRLMVRTERTKARERKKHDAVEIRRCSSDELERIDTQYASERPRGATPRYFEDVEEGDTVGPLVKGPLTVTDMICYHVGVGMGLYGVKPLRLGFQNRQRIPRFYQRDDLGVPDVLQRCHWDTEYARKAGNPTPYDYGRMRGTWLMHLCTDWMGDDAWLWKLDCEFRHFNFVGDVHWMSGTVARKYLAEGDRPAVDIDLRGENQRSELTTPGHATILLPSREHGPIRLPDPPGNGGLQQALDALSQRFDRS